jgi:hypothetical protein
MYRVETHVWGVTHRQEHPGDEVGPVVRPQVPPEVDPDLVQTSVGYRVPNAAGVEIENATGQFGRRLDAHVVDPERHQRPASHRLALLHVRCH